MEGKGWAGKMICKPQGGATVPEEANGCEETSKTRR